MSLIESEWFTEIFERNTAFSVRYSKKLYGQNSEFQKIEIFDTEVMGRVLILDGCFMVTEKDTFIYHEMLVHPAMNVLKDPRKVVVIGGGDGGAVTEIVKYPGVESVTLCEIDPMVVASCKEYLPEISAGLADGRVTVVNEDGAVFIRNFEQELDLVLVDSTDPVGPGTVLFETPFFKAIRRSLKRGGVAVFQTESPLLMESVFRAAVKDLRTVFGSDKARPYVATIPSYPGALWSFTFCSEERNPLNDSPRTLVPFLEGRLRFYDENVHRAAFALPVFVRNLISGQR